MLPEFLVHETIVRESGEAAVFTMDQDSPQTLFLTFSITHAVERQSIQFEVFGSEDGRLWHPEPLLKLTPKCYCGDYPATVHRGSLRHLKVIWKVTRWARSDGRPYFSFHVFAKAARTYAAYAGAA